MSTTLQAPKCLDLGKYVEVGANYLRLSADLPAEAISGIYYQIKALGGALHWMVGDLFAQLDRIKGSDFARHLMDDWDLSYSRATACKRVCEVFAADMRRPRLSFSHHEQALELCSTVEAACGLLDYAQEHELSIAAMRRHHHGLQSRQIEPSAAAPSAALRPLYDSIRQIERLRHQPFDAPTRAQLKTDLEPVIKFWEAL